MTRKRELLVISESELLIILLKLINFKMSTASFEKCQRALRLYRQVMKLHIRNMPNDLRLFGNHFIWVSYNLILTLIILGDLYVKQEFRLHLDKATDD